MDYSAFPLASSGVGAPDPQASGMMAYGGGSGAGIQSALQQAAPYLKSLMQQQQQQRAGMGGAPGMPRMGAGNGVQWTPMPGPTMPSAPPGGGMGGLMGGGLMGGYQPGGLLGGMPGGGANPMLTTMMMQHGGLFGGR